MFALKLNSNAQISKPGIPPSFKYKTISNNYDLREFPKPDIDKINLEDEKSSLKGDSYRIAVLISVNLNINNSGTWTNLPDGGRIWRLKLKSKDALALGVYYDKFYLPSEGELYLYNEDKTQVIGAFTKLNNTKNGLFATELIQGETVTLEYYEPSKSLENANISISEIAYAYRSVEFLFDKSKNYYGQSGPCEVNINCSEGDNWQNQKRGVARIFIRIGNEGFWCSGSLINNVRQNGIPYLLTADHCKKSFSTGHIASPEDLDQWIFYFNYELPECSDTIGEPPDYNTMVGAKKIACGGNMGETGSDFYLVKLNEYVPVLYHTFFNGWNRENSSSPNGVCIHHPEGDVKKISTYTRPLVSSQWNGNGIQSHWKVVWSETENGHGVTEGGSSGSPLFDNHGRIVGTLTGGYASCDSSYINQPDFFGKFSYSWESNDTANSDSARLRDWIDPDNTGVITLYGSYLGINKTKKYQSIKIYPNPTNDFINIDVENKILKVVKINVYNILGEMIESYDNKAILSNNIKIDLSSKPAGIYFVKISTNKESKSFKISLIK